MIIRLTLMQRIKNAWVEFKVKEKETCDHDFKVVGLIYHTAPLKNPQTARPPYEMRLTGVTYEVTCTKCKLETKKYKTTHTPEEYKEWAEEFCVPKGHIPV